MIAVWKKVLLALPTCRCTLRIGYSKERISTRKSTAETELCEQHRVYYLNGISKILKNVIIHLKYIYKGAKDSLL